MQLIKYVEAIKKTDEEKEGNLATAYAAQTAAEVNLEIEKQKIAISKQENEVIKLAGKHPLQLQAIMNAQDELTWRQRQLKQLQELHTALF